MARNLFTTVEMETEGNISTKLVLPFDGKGIAMMAGSLFPMAVFGVVANIVTMIVIYQAPGLKSVFNQYIMSLCFSDLVSSLLSPLNVYRSVWGYEEWKLPEVLCKIFFAGDFATSISTSLHILTFSALRLVSIAKPHIFNRFTITHAKISIACIWVFSFIVGFLPSMLFTGKIKFDQNSNSVIRSRPACSVLRAWFPYAMPYNFYVNALLFCGSLSLVFVLSSMTSILLLVRRTQRKEARKKRPNGNRQHEAERNRRAKENHAIVQLSLIVGSFAIGYVPNARNKTS